MCDLRQLVRLNFHRFVVGHLVLELAVDSILLGSSFLGVVLLLKRLPNVLRSRLVRVVLVVQILRQTIKYIILAQKIILFPILIIVHH